MFRPSLPFFRIFILLFLAGVSGYSQVLTYTNNTAGTLATVAANVTATSLARVNGAATPGAPCGSGFSVSAFANVTVYSAGLAAVEVSVTPNTGFTINITGFSAGLRRSASGPANVRYAYSTDGGATWIDQGTDQVPNNAACGITTTGTWTTPIAVPAPLTLRFRIYGFNAPSASGALQLLNLVLDGTVAASAACAVPPGLTSTLTTPSSATLGWTAIPGALSYNIRYRPSGGTTWSFASSAGIATTISGLTAGTVYECQVETVCPSGTSGYSSSAFFTTTASGTGSASSGKIAIYFNHPVDTTVSTGQNAVYLNNAMADTIVAYINRAKYTLDIAMYSYNQSAGYANIAAAINSRVASGVRVRYIYDGSQANTGLALLSAGVHTFSSPTTSAYGIMHNKIMIIDANSSDPNDAIVATGSTNWGINQLNTDHNNQLFIQDSALAHAYLNHFNMMWGDTGTTPNTTLSKFGPFKTDLGAHIFTIGGKTVELYFSPADHTDSHIQSSINSANTDLYFGVFTFTIPTCANAIVSRNTSGVYTPGIVDENSSTGGTAYSILTSGLGSLMKTQTGATLYHSKLLVADPSNSCSDPLVLTGSHNWSNAADTKNDENVIIIHSDTIANVYYQSFHADYAALGGTLTPIAPCATTTCGTPTGLSVTSVATTTAILNWASLSGALSYNIQYRQAGSSTWSTTTAALNSVTITGLSPATAYEFQVQAVCTSGTGAFSTINGFSTLALPCSVPSGLMVSGIDTDIATVSWIAVAGAVSYNVQYRTVGTGAWTTISAATNTITLSSLATATTYEFQVQVVCASGSSIYSAPSTFSTTAAPIVTTACPTPVAAAIPITNFTGSSCIFHWLPVIGAVSYNIRHHVVGSGSWTNASTVSTSAMITGLSPWATYEFQVQAVCSATSKSAYSGSSLFTTILPDGIDDIAADDTRSLSVFPNPTSGELTLSYRLRTSGTVSIGIYDLVGREILPVVTSMQQPMGEHFYKVNIPVPGLYFVKLFIGNAVVTQKVIKL